MQALKNLFENSDSLPLKCLPLENAVYREDLISAKTEV